MATTFPLEQPVAGRTFGRCAAIAPDRGEPLNAEERYQALLDELHAEFPRFRLIDKSDSMLQRSIAWALAVVTFGGQRRYLSDYVTTLGERVYLPSTWPARSAVERTITLRHERVHLRQFRRWGFPLMAVVYLLVPLPLGLAYGRYRFERAAFEETLRATFELLGRERVCDAAFRSRIVAQFTAGAYGWMWPFPRAIERWYDRTLAALDG